MSQQSSSSNYNKRRNLGLHEGAIIILFAVAVVLFLALISFSSADPGWSNIGHQDQIENVIGPFGAWLSSVLFALVGQPAFILPVLLFYRMSQLIIDRHKSWAWHWDMFLLRQGGWLLLFASLCSLFTLHFHSDVDASAGGYLGVWLSEILYSALSLIGTSLILLVFLFLGLTLATGLSWMQLFEKTGDTTLKAYELLRSKISQKRQDIALEKEQKVVLAQRKATLEINIEKQAKRQPPQIKPLPPKAPVSDRVVKEKQVDLFSETVDLTRELPPLSLLDEITVDENVGYSEESLEAMSRLLEIKLKDFGVVAEVVAVEPGPVITRFEIQPAAGVKVSKISNLAKDLARSLAMVSVRVVEIIPGKSVIGIEVPNENRAIVQLAEVLSSNVFDKAKSPLTVALGHDIGGQPVVADIGKMPHLLVAGTTGSGKSVGVNAMLCSLLYKATPDELRLMLVDPKMLELAVYEGIPHLLTPVITDMKDAANGLRWCVAEMERRYKLMAAMGVRNLAGFNRKVKEANAKGEPIPDPLWDVEQNFDNQVIPNLEPLPSIVVVIDEFADMMMVVGKKVEELIARIAQKARAAGIHLLLATQRPSVDVITGLIKANVPTRIAFQVSSKIDSRTILDQGGAEQLLGHGDMLYQPPGTGLPVRVHGAYVDDDEVHRLVADWKQRGQPEYLDEILSGDAEAQLAVPGIDAMPKDENGEADALFDEAVAFVTSTRKVSISSVQRKLRIGYNRAANLVEAMEAAGVVSTPAHNGSREVIAPPPVEF